MNARPSFADIAAEFAIDEPLPPSTRGPLEGPELVMRWVGIGHNAPPEPTPFEAVKAAVDDLTNEAQHWLDGSGVNSEAEAEAVGKLVVMIRKARTAADDERKAEKAEADKIIKEIQDRYNPILKRADLATDLAKRALTPWLVKVAQEKERIATEARAEAALKAAEAAELVRAAAMAGSLAASEIADAAQADATRARQYANAKERDTAKVGAATGSRAVSLRSYWTATMTDDGLALQHYLATRLDDINALLADLARQDVAAGKRTIPGFEITEEKRAA